MLAQAPEALDAHKDIEQRVGGHHHYPIIGSAQSLVDNKSSNATAIKQGAPYDGVWRDQLWSSVGAISTKL